MLLNHAHVALSCRRQKELLIQVKTEYVSKCMTVCTRFCIFVLSLSVLFVSVSVILL